MTRTEQIVVGAAVLTLAAYVALFAYDPSKFLLWAAIRFRNVPLAFQWARFGGWWNVVPVAVVLLVITGKVRKVVQRG